MDIFVSQRANVADPWGVPRNLGPTINTASADHCPFVSPDGHTTYVVAGLRGGQSEALDTSGVVMQEAGRGAPMR